jgi:hypothetical protein
MRKGKPNEIHHTEFQELLNKKYNDHTISTPIGQRRKKKKRIHGHNRSAINTKKDKRPIINIQRRTKSHHRRNTKATNQDYQSDIH